MMKSGYKLAGVQYYNSMMNEFLVALNPLMQNQICEKKKLRKYIIMVVNRDESLKKIFILCHFFRFIQDKMKINMVENEYVKRRFKKKKKKLK